MLLISLFIIVHFLVFILLIAVSFSSVRLTLNSRLEYNEFMFVLESVVVGVAVVAAASSLLWGSWAFFPIASFLSFLFPLHIAEAGHLWGLRLLSVYFEYI